MPIRSAERPGSIGAAFACALCMSLGLAPLFIGTLPVFLPHVSAEMGWGAAVFPQAALTAGLASALVGPFTGGLLDQFGVRKVMLTGLLCWAASLFAMSWLTSSHAQLLGCAALLGVSASACGPIALAKVVAGWFDRHRGVALAIVLSAAPAIMTAVFILIAQRLVGSVGWRVTYGVFSVLIVCVAMPVAWFMMWEAPTVCAEEAGVSASGMNAMQALRCRAFWTLMALIALICGALNAVVVHFMGWSAESAIDVHLATISLSAFSLVGPLGPLLAGLIADRARGPRALAPFFGLPFLGVLLLVTGGRRASLPAMIVMGLGFSASTAMLPYLLTRYFGIRYASQIFGIGLGIVTLAMGGGPVLLGMVRDSRHSLLPAVPALLALLGAAVLVALTLPVYKYGGRVGRPENLESRK
jgi:predicted MFS family arabinose efflux permease